MKSSRPYSFLLSSLYYLFWTELILFVKFATIHPSVNPICIFLVWLGSVWQTMLGKLHVIALRSFLCCKVVCKQRWMRISKQVKLQLADKLEGAWSGGYLLVMFCASWLFVSEDVAVRKNVWFIHQEIQFSTSQKTHFYCITGLVDKRRGSTRGILWRPHSLFQNILTIE